jgi:hypothetical protein
VLRDQSDRLRQEVVAELENLQKAAIWVEKGFAVAQTMKSLWPLLAGLAGIMVARRGGGWLRKLGKAWSFWRLARQVTGLWPKRA